MAIVIKVGNGADGLEITQEVSLRQRKGELPEGVTCHTEQRQDVVPCVLDNGQKVASGFRSVMEYVKTCRT